MEENKNQLITKEKVASLAKNINSASDVIVTGSIFGILIYLYQYSLIKVQDGGIGSFEKYEVNWETIVFSLFLLLGTIGLNYILRGLSGVIRLLFDIREK